MLAQSQLPAPSPGSLPDVPPSAFVALLAIGFLIAGIGHLYRSGPVVALGMILIVIAGLVLPIVVFLTGSAP